MNKFLVGILATLILFGIGVTQVRAQTTPCTLPLYEKDSEWSIVEDGANGIMTYNASDVHVEASGLEFGIGYSLIEYPESQTTWPWPVIVIVSGTTDESGNLNLSASYGVKAGEKYWIALASDIIDGSFTGWQPSEYLFEGFLIPDNKCLVAPEPVPTPETCVGDQHLDATGLKCVSFSQAGPPPQGPYTPPGQVLGASTGKVLGASTLAGTGSFAENLYLAIMAIGGIITAVGVKSFKKAI